MASAVGERVIALIDMDCFYVQVEVRERPELVGKPVGVVQYNAHRRGGLIAVSYEARAAGVKRGMRANEAEELCPDMAFVSTPTVEDKIDLTRYRKASEEVFDVLNAFSPLLVVERASIDEAYLDLTALVEREVEELGEDEEVGEPARYPSTFVLREGLAAGEEEREARLEEWLRGPCAEDPAELRLALGARAVEAIRARVLAATRFHCSAGIANCKTLAKLICARHKPRQQSLLCPGFLGALWDQTPVRKVRNLGGKFGQQLVDRFGETMGHMARLEDGALRDEFGAKTGGWLAKLLRGQDEDPVVAKNQTKSIGSSKNFPGRDQLDTLPKLHTWCFKLAKDLTNRLKEDMEEKERTATSLSLGWCVLEKGETSRLQSKSCPMGGGAYYNPEAFAKSALGLLKRFLEVEGERLKTPVVHLGFSAGKFVVGKDYGSRSLRTFVRSPAKTPAPDPPKPPASPGPSTSRAEVAEAEPSPSRSGAVGAVDAEPVEGGVEGGLAGTAGGWEEAGRQLAEPRPPSPKRRPVSRTEGSGPLDESLWVDADDADLFPQSLDQISPQDWADLPPILRFELRGMCRQKEPQAARQAAGKPAKSKGKKPKKAQETGVRSRPITHFFRPPSNEPMPELI